MAYLRDIEKLIRIALPREDRRTPGHRDSRAGAFAASRRAVRAARRMAAGAMKPHRDRKGLAVAAVPVVIMARRKPTGTSQPAGAVRPSQGGGKAEGMQGVAFLHRESRPNTRPNRTQRPTLTVDRSGDNHG